MKHKGKNKEELVLLVEALRIENAELKVENISLKKQVEALKREIFNLA